MSCGKWRDCKKVGEVCLEFSYEPGTDESEVGHEWNSDYSKYFHEKNRVQTN
jgi:hypothetical protein